MKTAAALTILAWLASAGAAAALDWTAPVAVDGGAAIGLKQGDLSVFRGIPYAAPPVRGLRWKPPQPVAPFKDTWVADRFAPMCLQALRAKNSVFYNGEEPSSEDCLYLNVWTPELSADAKRPVMVFVYGGGWTIGSASLPLYSGAGLAQKGAVVVSFNYRVGALGFFAHPELTAESPDKASGNYGLMDMIAALKWVRGNIARFGGDPDNVTLYGQSAGAVSISQLEAAPQARGLFQKAIGESGAYGLGSPLPSLAEAEKAGVALQQKLKAPDLKALRDLGGDALVAAYGGIGGPDVDGLVFPEQPATTYAEGREAKIPVLIGSNENEGTPYPVAKSAAAFAEDARKAYGDKADAFLALYPAPDDAAAAQSSYALFRDKIFAGPVRQWARAQSKVAPTYLYHFSRVPPFPAGLSYAQQSPASRLGAYHGAEMAYAYRTLDSLNQFGQGRAWTDDDRKLSDILSSYWFDFAKTGDPNAAGLPHWPAYDAASETTLLIGDAISTGPLPHGRELDFLAAAATH